jgi:cytochrome c oxidase subunit 2
MKKLWIVFVTFAMLIGLSITASASGDAAAGKKLYKLCTPCHGANGAGDTIISAPLIAGQAEWYLARQIMNFRAGVRGGSHTRDGYGSTMRAISILLRTDKDVNDVSAYVASLSAPASASTIKTNTTAGKQTYILCQACHGPSAGGNELMNAPRLAGQYDWYIVRQIENFRAGIRGAHAKDTFGKQMAGIAKTLPDDTAIKNVAAYIQTLK